LIVEINENEDVMTTNSGNGEGHLEEKYVKIIVFVPVKEIEYG
jgi:hypothetical protein